MTTCPLCQKNLGDLNPIMDQLANDKMRGELQFVTKCCGKQMRAFSSFMAYYIKPVSGNYERVLIGHA